MADVDDAFLRYDTSAPAALEGKFERHRHLLPAFAAAAAEPEVPAPSWSEADFLNRARGCLMGLAIGEAMGSAVEYLPRDAFDPVTGLTGGGPLDLAPGEWTDGTAMALCLAQSLLATETVEQDDFMTRLAGWLTRGANTPQGRCLAVGTTTRAAIESFIADDEASAGSEDARAAGNGSLIRLAPLAIYAVRQPGVARFLSSKQSRATHATIEVLDACDLLTAMLVDALQGLPRDRVLRPRVMQLTPNTLAINAGEWREKSRDQLRSSAYVIDTLDAAVWSVGTTDSFADAVLTAANLGGDAAGVAAVAGQLAGAIHGAASIPPEWRAAVAWSDRLEALATDLAIGGASAFPAPRQP